MHYVSTRDRTCRVSGAQAIAMGLAPDGGLFLPERLPLLPEGMLRELCTLPYARRAAKIMALFLEEFSEEELEAIACRAYGGNKFPKDSPAPLRKLREGVYILELWHGPTCAFKDMALQMLPELLVASLKKLGEKRTVCILTATSGDTGKAALEGFRDVEGTRILVFYPKDGVSAVQRLQMTTQQGENVGVLGIEGNFDDAQRAVKEIFSDRSLREKAGERGMIFSSANSINWGRLLPQVVYYISAYCDLVSTGAISEGEAVDIVVPTGNFGNILAAYLAKKMGLPAAKLICASNENRVLTDFFSEGVYQSKRPFHTTISPSMDILVSSNLERLLWYGTDGDCEAVRTMMEELRDCGCYQISETLSARLSEDFSAASLTDPETGETIGRIFGEDGYLLDPHTAVAVGAWEKTGEKRPVLIASTASPFKFCASVLSALGEPPSGDGPEWLDRLSEKTGWPVPLPLADLCQRKERFTDFCGREEIREAAERMLGIN